MYWDITLFGMRIQHTAIGVPEFQPHPLSERLDLSLLPPFDFRTTGDMPRVLSKYARLTRAAREDYAGRLAVTFPGSTGDRWTSTCSCADTRALWMTSPRDPRRCPRPWTCLWTNGSGLPESARPFWASRPSAHYLRGRRLGQRPVHLSRDFPQVRSAGLPAHSGGGRPAERFPHVRESAARCQGSGSRLSRVGGPRGESLERRRGSG